MARSKIETALSENDLQCFCNKLTGTPNLTLKKLKELAAEIGIDVSLMGAKTFRDGAYQSHLDKLRKARELAQQVAEFNDSDSAGSLADAGAAVLMQEVFNVMTSGGEIDFDAFSKIISRLRTGDHRQRELTARLKEFERREAEWKRKETEREAAKEELSKAISQRGMSEDTLREIEEKIKLL